MTYVTCSVDWVNSKGECMPVKLEGTATPLLPATAETPPEGGVELDDVKNKEGLSMMRYLTEDERDELWQELSDYVERDDER